MPRKLKVFTTSIEFYDLAIAAPSMKAALEVWGAHSNLFHQNFARGVNDAATVEVAMSHPGVVLKRPVGSNKPFAETSDLPDDLAVDARTSSASRKARPARSKKDASVSATKSRDASAAYDREEKKRQVRQRRDQEKLDAARQRRDAAVAKAEVTIAAAEADHRARLAAISKDRAELDKREAAETDRWDAIRQRLQQALQRAEGRG